MIYRIVEGNGVETVDGSRSKEILVVVEVTFTVSLNAGTWAGLRPRPLRKAS